MQYQFSTAPTALDAGTCWLVYCGRSGAVVAKGLSRGEAEALCQRLNAERHPESILRALEQRVTLH